MDLKDKTEEIKKKIGEIQKLQKELTEIRKEAKENFKKELDILIKNFEKTYGVHIINVKYSNIFNNNVLDVDLSIDLLK